MKVLYLSVLFNFGQPIAGSVLAQDIQPIDLQFVATDRLVIAGKHKAAAYRVDNEGVSLLNEVTNQAVIIGILPTVHRHRYGLLDEKGKISLYLLLNEE